MPETYFTVEMSVFAFDTREQADAFAEALVDAFTDMPEAGEYGASFRVKEVVDE